MKIVHLIPNDRKYLQHIIDVMEAVNPGGNRIFASPSGTDVVTDLQENETLSLPVTREAFVVAVAMALKDAEAVFVHGMNRLAATALAESPPDVVIVWCQWGADLTSISTYLKDRQYLPATYAAVTRKRSKRLLRRIGGPKSMSILRDVLGRRRGPGWMRPIAERIDLYCGIEPIPGIEAELPGFRAEWHPEFKYYSTRASLEPGPPRMNGPDVLVGNRATPSCNHLEAFAILKRIGFSGRIFIPLSYGRAEYADFIEARARELFGDRARPLRDWMPIEDYFSVLATCGTVLMNQCRGQALGTTAMALFKGARVLLRSENSHFRFYARHDVKVFALDRPGTVDLIGQPLAAAEKIHNRQAVEAIWSEEAVLQRAREIIAAAEHRLTARHATAHRSTSGGPALHARGTP